MVLSNCNQLMKSHLVIVGLGEVVPYKYMECITESVSRGELDSYSIIDIESQKKILKNE